MELFLGYPTAKPPRFMLVVHFDRGKRPLSKLRVFEIDAKVPPRIVDRPDLNSFPMFPVAVAVGDVPALDFGKFVRHAFSG